VFLNVYNIHEWNRCLRTCGLPIYHSAIEVYGVEYAFGGHSLPSTGIFDTKPFHELIELGGVLPDSISLHEQHYVVYTSVRMQHVLLCESPRDRDARIHTLTHAECLISSLPPSLPPSVPPSLPPSLPPSRSHPPSPLSHRESQG
jgi:hypothetical protein